MARLPDELLDEIFAHCDLDTLGRFTCTAKYLKGERVWLQLRTWNLSWNFPASLEKRMFAAFANERSKLVNIKGSRNGPLDARAKAVIALMEKIGARIECFAASHKSYATMAGPMSQQFAEKCWAHLNPSSIRKITFTETFQSPEIALRLFRNGCPKLEKLSFTAYADSVPGLLEVLSNAPFSNLRVIRLGSRHDSSIYIPFIRLLSDQLDCLQCDVSPDPGWEEIKSGWMADLLESRNPLDLEELNVVCKRELGVSIEKVRTDMRYSLLGGYIYRALTHYKPVLDLPNVLDEFKQFFRNVFSKQYPTKNSFSALLTLAGLIDRANGADNSFVSAMVEWLIPLTVDHKSFKNEHRVWTMLHHASSYHGLNELAEKCFASLQALYETRAKEFSPFDLSHHHTFNRLMQLPADWMRRYLRIDEPGQYAKVLELISNTPQCVKSLLGHEVFDPNLPCNKKKGKTILHHLLEAGNVDALSQIGLALFNRIQKFDSKKLKLQPPDRFYVLRRIFETDDLITLYRHVVPDDWRLLVNINLLKEVPNASMALKIINFIDSYPTKLTEDQKTKIFEAVWQNAILKSFKEEQLDSNIRSIVECFPGREVPKFIEDALIPPGPIKIGTSKAPLEIATIEKVISKHFKADKQASCDIS
eukprot:TRINITY_DN15696_c0_g1_i1.p1 TRINITY_DN15696_c0_g1~~TRINITY_DN15696_c0_g1_i1.p1  ORF type:complete len:670 (+),score=87.52 TRINITY_DN15696_c0_g1_i1:71-2011(+)